MAAKKRKAIGNARRTEPTPNGSVRSAVLGTLFNMSVTVLASVSLLLGLIAVKHLI
jgi:hypothetical protein